MHVAMRLVISLLAAGSLFGCSSGPFRMDPDPLLPGPKEPFPDVGQIDCAHPDPRQSDYKDFLILGFCARKDAVNRKVYLKPFVERYGEHVSDYVRAKRLAETAPHPDREEIFQ